MMKRILFVCIENSCRSQMAEAFARIHGREKVEIYSAGSRPLGQIDPKAIELMWEIGYDLTRHTSKSLKEVPDIEYDAVITMGCGDQCPLIRGKYREDGAVPDPKYFPSAQFRQIKNSIENKVRDLLKRLEAD